MKNILSITIALCIGLASGYFLFSESKDHVHTADHGNNSTRESKPTSEEIYTCSMHPQIRQNEPGECPLCGMDLIPLKENTSNDPLVLEMTPEAVKLANIQTTILGAKSSALENTTQLSGKVQPDERLASSQVAHVPGRIEKLYVSFTGEQVTKGQKIARLYSPELITAQRELLEALKLQELNPGLVEAARNKLRYWKIGDSTIESIEQSGSIQETFTVYAEDTGIVSQKRVSVGDYVRQGEPIFDLMNLRRVWVLFDAYEEDLGAIALGDKISFTTPATADKIFNTRVTFIDPVINPNTRVASIRTEIQNMGGLLKPEMLVYGTLQQKSAASAPLTVPKSAVLWTGKRSVVYVKVPEETIPSFQFREVNIGEAQGNTYQVLNGLEAGEEVVTYGSFAIDAAAQLNNQASMMNRNIGIKKENDGTLLPDYTEQTPTAFKAQLARVADAYLSLKDALVATDEKQAIPAAEQVVAALAKVDMTLLKEEAHLYWMEQVRALQSHSKKITELMEVEEQRKQFDFLSQVLINTIKVYGMPSDTLYVQHCPMANNNTGADWLSRESAIRNPYFGDQMLTCGLVKDTLSQGF